MQKTLAFGIQQSASIFNNVMEVVASKAPPHLLELLKTFRHLDNILASYRTPQQVISVYNEIKSITSKYNLPVKELDTSQGVTPIYSPNTPPIIIYGIFWHRFQDKISPVLNLSHLKKQLTWRKTKKTNN